jgi:hypothetical protein
MAGKNGWTGVKPYYPGNRRCGGIKNPDNKKAFALLQAKACGKYAAQEFALMNSPIFGQITSRQRRPEKMP